MTISRTSAETAELRYRRAVKKLTYFLKNWLYLIIAAGVVITLVGNDISYWDYAYFDSDGYMRALRVWHWLAAPSFWEQPITESNYPFGEILHWSRPTDILWILNTLPFLHLDNLHDIVFLGGIFLAPWLCVLSAIALAYGLRRQFNVYLTIFGCCIFLADPIMQTCYAIGRPDHHALMTLLGIYAVSLNLCWLKKRHNRYLRLLGFSLALASFAAIEGIFLYLLFLSFFLWLYIFKNVSLIPAVKTAKYFAISLTVFWLINPPYQGWLYPDNGRISILYATFSWFVFIALRGIELGHLHTRALKIWSLICAALGTALLLLVCFGIDICNFPLDTEINHIWGSRISEMRPVWRQNWKTILCAYPFGAGALILSAILLRCKPYRRMMLLNLCLGLPLFALSLIAIRVANYQSLYNILPWLCLIDLIYKKSAHAQRKTLEFPVSVQTLALGILLVQQFLFLPYYIANLNKKKAPVFSSALCQNVRNIGGTLVTDNFLTPRYIWHCGVNTVGTPYHRNRIGLIDSHNLLQGTNDRTIVPLLLKHQITQILLFDDYDDKYYDLSPDNADKLYYRLIKRENIPSYLEEVPSPMDNVRHYRIKI